jgi:hypothetical protein
VLDSARLVRIVQPTIEAIADGLAGHPVPVPEWDTARHYVGPPAQTAQWVLVLDALNFCFWADPGEARWQVEDRGEWVNGYWALAVALKRAVAEGVPILDAEYLARMSVGDLARVLRGRGLVPMLEQRLANVREVGRGLLASYGGQFANVISRADRSAVALVRLLARDFPSFDDVATYQGREVRFYKRAQICAADLYGALGGAGLGELRDLDRLTAFADYKVPQVLRGLGILEYSPELAAKVDARAPIAPSSADEVEIRAATIWGVEELRRALAGRGRSLTASEVDWYLWDLGQHLPPDVPPYHLTRTVYY